MSHWNDQEPKEYGPEGDDESWEVLFDGEEEALKDPGGRLGLRVAGALDRLRREDRPGHSDA
jgi:hypothetical protein